MIVAEMEEPVAVAEENTRVWRNDDGRIVPESEVFGWIQKVQEDSLENGTEYQVIIGTDSKLSRYQFRFITVLCVYKLGKGGYYYYLESFLPKSTFFPPRPPGAPRIKGFKGNQKLRMFTEVEKSCELASVIFEALEVVPEIHIDASPEESAEFTSAFSNQLKGYVEAAGWKCQVKPEAWVANAVADKLTRQ